MWRNVKEKMGSTLLLTIDVEDWFQVENFKQYFPFSLWSSQELRVEKNTHRLLDLLDSIDASCSSQFNLNGSYLAGRKENYNEPSNINHRKHNEADLVDSDHDTSKLKKESDHLPAGVAFGRFCPENCKWSMKSGKHYQSCQRDGSPKGTFFILGWLAKKLPHLIREIHARGHEVASHGYSHNLCYNCGDKELREDLSKSKKLLEDIIGSSVYGYRAPSFSINNDVLKIIEGCNYLYDSSFNSFSMHGRYGQPELSSYKKDGIVLKLSESFYELPISNFQFSIFNSRFPILNSVWPWGGGGYFRLFPSRLFEKGVKSILKKDGAYLFYMHPWEIDPEQPRVSEASALFKFRHYINLKNCESKLYDLINCFKDSHFVTCHQYITELNRPQPTQWTKDLDE